MFGNDFAVWSFFLLRRRGSLVCSCTILSKCIFEKGCWIQKERDGRYHGGVDDEIIMQLPYGW